MAATQKALLLNEKFGRFEVQTISKPSAGPGEILVKVHSAALNPVDWKIQKYGLFLEKFPVVLGSDIAGDVEDVGTGVVNVQKGDRVIGQGQFVNEFAGFQQYALMQASTSAKIPSNISYDEASTIPAALTISYVLLYNKSPYGFGFKAPLDAAARGMYNGTPIVILGGSSSVGQMEIQLAKLSGFSPIIAAASLKNKDFLISLGADTVLSRDLSASELNAEITQLTSAPLNVVIDTISVPLTQKIGIDLLAPGGKLATVLPSTLNESDIGEGKSAFAGVGMVHLSQNLALIEELYDGHLEQWLKEGLIKPNRVEVLPRGLAGIPDGLERLERDEVSLLKLVARPQETN